MSRWRLLSPDTGHKVHFNSRTSRDKTDWLTVRVRYVSREGVYDMPRDRGTIRLAKTGLNWAFNRGGMMINRGIVGRNLGTYSKTGRKINRGYPRGRNTAVRARKRS